MVLFTCFLGFRVEDFFYDNFSSVVYEEWRDVEEMERKVLYRPMFKTGWFWGTFAKLRVVGAGGRGDERERERKDDLRRRSWIICCSKAQGSRRRSDAAAAREWSWRRRWRHQRGVAMVAVAGVRSRGGSPACFRKFCVFCSCSLWPPLLSPLSLSLVEFGVFTQLLRRSL